MRTHWCLRFRHNHVCSTLHQQEEFLAGHVCELANRTCGHFEMAVVQGTSEIYLVMSNPHYKQLPVDQILSFGCVSVGVWKRFLQNCSFHLLVIALFFGCSKSIFILKLMVDRNGSVSKPCTPVVHIKIAGKWMFIPLKMVLIGIDPYPNPNPKPVVTVPNLVNGTSCKFSARMALTSPLRSRTFLQDLARGELWDQTGWGDYPAW